METSVASTYLKSLSVEWQVTWERKIVNKFLIIVKTQIGQIIHRKLAIEIV